MDKTQKNAVPLIIRDTSSIQSVQIHQDKGDYIKISPIFSPGADILVPILTGIIVGIIVGLIVGQFANSFRREIEKERQKREDEKEKSTFIKELQREYAIALYNLNSGFVLEAMAQTATNDRNGVSIPMATFKEHDLNTLAAVNDYILRTKKIEIEGFDKDIIFNSYSTFSQCIATLKVLVDQMERAIFNQQNVALYHDVWGRLNSGNIIPGIFISQGAILEVIIKMLEHYGKDFTSFRSTDLYKKIVKYQQALRRRA